MSDIKIRLDIQPGMSFFQKHHKLYFMITGINKDTITFEKLHDTMTVVQKTTTELYELLHNEEWVDVTDQGMILATDGAKRNKSKAETAQKVVQDLQTKENYFMRLKRFVERYESNKLHERK